MFWCRPTGVTKLREAWQLARKITSRLWRSDTKMETPRRPGVSKSAECDIFPFSALTLLAGDRKDIRPLKNWMLVCWR